MGRISVIHPVLSIGEHYLTSEFGIRTLDKTTRMHNGVDLVGWDGAGTVVCDILAYDRGKVVAEGYNGEAGNFIRIQHGDMETYYCHLKKRSTYKVGSVVPKGAVIGEMGSSGLSTGAHLHFGVRANGAWVNPIPYLQEKNMDYEEFKQYMARYITEQNESAGSDWSRESLDWARSNGILFGDDRGNLMPKASCTREMVMVFLHRLYKLISK